MKKITLLLFTVATLFSFTQCTSYSSKGLCSNDETRAKVITELIDNEAYLKELMIALESKHSEAIVSTSCEMMRKDHLMGSNMMDSMMDLCMSDTNMCRMIMGKTMDLCEIDTSKSRMMMSSMKEHPKAMHSMKDMGMYDMDFSKKK